MENQNNKLNLKQQVRQGNIDAITTLLNRILEHKAITAKANLENGCLKVILESIQIPDEKISTTLIRRELASLKAECIRTVSIYGRQIGEEFPAWSYDLDFTIQQNPAQKQAIAPKQRTEKSQFIAGLRTFQFSSVVPYKDALSSDLYKSNTVKILLFFGLFPLAARLLTGRTGLEQTAWILGIYYSSIWAVVLYDLLKPAQFSWGDTLKCVLFTAFIGIPILVFVQKVPPFSVLYAATDELGLIPRLLGFVLGVGLLEESCKALPVYLFLLLPGKLQDPLSSAFYGAMSGLGFAIAEGALYSEKYAFVLSRGGLDFGSYILINTIRFVSLPLLHAIWAGIVGYFLGLAAINPSRNTAIIFIGVAISAVLHGLYDTFANDLLGFGILAFSITLFVAYLRRSKQMIDEMEQAELNYKK